MNKKLYWMSCQEKIKIKNFETLLTIRYTMEKCSISSNQKVGEISF